MPGRGCRLVMFCLLLACLLAPSARAVVLNEGDLVVTGNGAAGIFVARVDPVSGAQQIISQGGLLVSGRCVAVACNGMVYLDNSTNILRVNPADGSQSVFVALPVAYRTGQVSNMIAHSDGNLYYTSALGEVVRLDPSAPTPTPSLLTSQAAAIAITEGPGCHLYASTCVAANGTSTCTGLTTDIVVRRIDRVSGMFSTAGFGGIGKPRDIAFDARDSMYVESANDRRLFRFNQVTFASGPLPLFGNESSYTIQHMVGHPDGYLYLTHNYVPAGGQVDQIDPVSNARSSISSFPGSGLGAIAVVPPLNCVSIPICPTTAKRSTWGALKQIYR